MVATHSHNHELYGAVVSEPVPNKWNVEAEFWMRAQGILLAPVRCEVK
jgi:hypothetical protein